MRINKTKNNLQQVWNHLDEACGSLDNAMMNIGQMVDLPEDIVSMVELLDITKVVGLKNKIEKLIEDKEY